MVSVIVPVYKVEQYIHKCVQSVLAQSYNDFELILVDDGSPDMCPIICDEYAFKDKRIKVLHKINGGQSSARNIGLDVAKGDFITFLDSDDFWHEDYLKTSLELLNQYNADIVQCDFIRGIDTKFPKSNNTVTVDIFNNHEIFLSGNSKIIMWAKIYRKSLWQDVRMPIGKAFEDDFTTWKLYYKANVIITTNQKLYYYTSNPNSTMSNQKKKPKLDFIEAYDYRISFFKECCVLDLLEYTKIHFCKSLLLTFSNSKLSAEDKKLLMSKFLINWRDIHESQYLTCLMKTLFSLFVRMPSLVSNSIAFLKH